ncbi:MAG: phage head closure protein [Ruminococcus sp.]|nr:phage head closure protein [Ruminococcus sp.]
MAYNKKIEIQALCEEEDEIGQQISSWKTIFRPWASVNCTGGREYYKAAQTNSQNDMIFKIRYSKTISSYSTSEIRIVYNGRIHNIKHIDDYMQQHRELVIRAEEINGRG